MSGAGSSESARRGRVAESLERVRQAPARRGRGGGAGSWGGGAAIEGIPRRPSPGKGVWVPSPLPLTEPRLGCGGDTANLRSPRHRPLPRVLRRGRGLVATRAGRGMCWGRASWTWQPPGPSTGSAPRSR